jgi:hypothetical protein
MQDMSLIGQAFVTFTPKLVKFIKIKEDELNSAKSDDLKTDIKKRIEESKRIEYIKDFKYEGRIIRNIVLPINKIDDTLKSNYKLINGLDLLANGDYLKWGATNLDKLFKAVDGTGILDKLGLVGKGLSGIGNMMMNAPEELKAMFRSVIGNGYMSNPHDMMVYESVERRVFGVSYNLMKPQNSKEEETLKMIRDVFRASQVGNYKDNIWTVAAPATWFVSFTSYGKNQTKSVTPFLNYYNCGLTSSTFNFGDTTNNVNFSRTETGEPIYDMSLTFLELEKMGTRSWDENLKFISQG